tara:strand:+ start:734 stop:955 length:222 start_codon:yes stop_codon:yes gene_type:complete
MNNNKPEGDTMAMTIINSGFGEETATRPTNRELIHAIRREFVAHVLAEAREGKMTVAEASEAVKAWDKIWVRS